MVVTNMKCVNVKCVCQILLTPHCPPPLICFHHLVLSMCSWPFSCSIIVELSWFRWWSLEWWFWWWSGSMQGIISVFTCSCRMAFVIGVRYGESDRDQNYFPENWSSHHLELLQCMVTALLRVHWSGANSYINLSTSAKYFLSHNISFEPTLFISVK